MDRMDLALLIAARASALESRSALPDAPVVPPSRTAARRKGWVRRPRA